MNAPMPNLSQINQPLLFEMIRSFTTLARTLNLSHAVAELNSTRQTVRRHITQLEEIKGEPLFSVENRQYRLTEFGARALPEALDIMARGNAWLAGQSRRVDGLQYLHHIEPDGWCHYQQQHPVSEVFTSDSDLLRSVMQAWTLASGDLEHEMLRKVRPFCTISRQHNGEWLLTEVGEESAYVTWFGWKAARSNIGAVLAQMPGGQGFGRLVNVAYEEIRGTHSVRLDHIYTQFPYGPDGISSPICYQRLLLGARYPDQSYAMISVVRRTYDVQINGVTDEMLRQMPEEMLM
jgi:biotin operon repressor